MYYKRLVLRLLTNLLCLFFGVTGKGEGAGTGIDAEDGAGDVGEELDGVKLGEDAFGEGGGFCGDVTMQDGDVQLFAGFEELEEFAVHDLYAALVGAGKRHRFDQSGLVIDADEGLDLQEAADPLDGVADASALLQEIEGIHADKEDELLADAVDGFEDMLEIGTGFAGTGGGQDLPTEGHGGAFGVDNGDGGGNEFGGVEGALVGAAHGAADSEGDDVIGTAGGGFCVGTLEIGNAALGRGRVLWIGGKTAVKIDRLQVDAVAELVGAPEDVGRNDVDAILLKKVVGNIAGTVGNYFDHGLLNSTEFD